MDHRISPERSYAVSRSHDSLLHREHYPDKDITALNPKRTLKLHNKECCFRKVNSLHNLTIQDADNTRLCQRSTSNQMAGRFQLRPLLSQQKKITPSIPDPSDEALTLHEQPSPAEKPKVIEEKKSQMKSGLEIGSLGIIDSLKVIINGEGTWLKIKHSLIQCCAGMNQNTTDEEWLDYLNQKIQIIDNQSEKYWNRFPKELRILIQHILFSTLSACRRYKGSMPSINPVHLNNMNSAIQKILQHYYIRFGEDQFQQIFDAKTYPKRTPVNLLQYHAQYYDFDVIPPALETLLDPTAEELAYLPVLWNLRNGITTATTALDVDEQAIQETAERREQQRLLKIFTPPCLDSYLSPVDSMAGFSNYNNTCFAAVSVWQILVSPYIHLLSASPHPETIECDPEGVKDERYASLASAEETILLKNLSPEACLTLLKKASDSDSKTALFTAAIRNSLITMESQYRNKQYPDMQNTYELLLTLCTACAADDIFVGFEDFQERFIKFISGQTLQKKSEETKTKKTDQKDTLSVFPLKYLPQQDSAEFLAPLLKLVIPREQLNQCAFRVLTERRIMRGSDIVTVTDDPQTTPGNITETHPIKATVTPDTLIYSVPISLEQAKSNVFSLQRILDDALSFKPLPEGVHQTITIDRNNFKHAIHNLPTPLARAKETGTGDLLWDILQERQVLLVEEIPKVLTIQLKMLHDPYDRANVAEKLAHDVTQEFQLTFRKASQDAELPPDEITQKYKIVVKVFYVEEGEARTRHYRCLINGRERLPENDAQELIDQVVMDDKRVFNVPPDQEPLSQLGILCMFTAEKITSSPSHRENADRFMPMKTDHHNT
ncbi:hypothetical protein [Endozoicomonas sp. SCSIO W0465]|uniref:hypothetical protein n=1 Tax=Endozoicomonas sp. SCSIO W0465 TaxID=2918516 RepID=UPI0020762617|nr:hypothetical protein [Endozoicomonas sp. SCSIO W0465]USE38633.1 hypothetical protein MJO57_10960 [Endozoicomonas sp. SCSIO W0465]